MSEYVIVHATRHLAADDKRRPRQTMETLAELPDPTVSKSGHVSYLTGRRIDVPGFSGGWVWASVSDAARYPTKAAATKALRAIGRSGPLIIDVDTVTEWERQRHLARARAKARRI